MKKKIQEKRKQVQSGGEGHSKPHFRDEEEYGRQLMLELGQPKL